MWISGRVSGSHSSTAESFRWIGPKLPVAAIGGVGAPGWGHTHVWGSVVVVVIVGLSGYTLGEPERI
jgi:hypothetical protein